MSNPLPSDIRYNNCSYHSGVWAQYGLWECRHLFLCGYCIDNEERVSKCTICGQRAESGWVWYVDDFVAPCRKGGSNAMVKPAPKLAENAPAKAGKAPQAPHE